MATSSPSTSTQEFTIRAPGSRHASTQYSIGVFPTGPPGFKERKAAAWELTREAPLRGGRRQEAERPAAPWVLEDAPGSATHRGTPEGGLAVGGGGGGAGYFVLVKEGADFVALPLDGWYTFRPVQKYKMNGLEEAERLMSMRTQMHFSTANPRLAAMAARVEEEGVVEGDEGSGGEGEEEGEEEAQAVRAARARSGGAVASGGPDAPPIGGALPGDERPGEEGSGPGPKGEDWEHEEERADDDVDMGDEGDDSAEAGGEAGRPRVQDRGPRAAGSSGSDAPGGSPGSIGGGARALRAGGGSSDDSEGHVGEEEGEEDEDLDAMASGLHTQVLAARGRPGRDITPPPLVQPSALPPVGSKRKAEAPPAEAAKKARGPGEGGQGQPSEADVVAFLRERGPAPPAELSAAFKRRLRTPEARKAFSAMVKRLGRLEERPPGSGTRVIVLKAA